MVQKCQTYRVQGTAISGERPKADVTSLRTANAS